MFFKFKELCNSLQLALHHFSAFFQFLIVKKEHIFFWIIYPCEYIANFVSVTNAFEHDVLLLFKKNILVIVALPWFLSKIYQISGSRKGMSMPTWLLDFLAKPTVIRSTLLSHRGRSGVDGGLWGSRSHLCNRFMVKCYTNAYKGFSLSLFPAPSFISLSFSFFAPLYLLSFSFFFLSASSSSLFLRRVRTGIVECIGTSEHPLVIVVANPLAAAGTCALPFASYRSLRSNEHFERCIVRSEISGNRR